MFIMYPSKSFSMHKTYSLGFLQKKKKKVLNLLLCNSWKLLPQINKLSQTWVPTGLLYLSVLTKTTGLSTDEYFVVTNSSLLFFYLSQLL